MNTAFDGTTKLELDGTPVNELTVYAKWGLSETGSTEGWEIEPPQTGLEAMSDKDAILILVITFAIMGVVNITILKRH